MPLELGPCPELPSTMTEPWSGGSKPAMTFNSVDLPHPEGPTMATNSPSPTSKLTSSITGSSPWSVAKPFFRSLTAILVGIAPPHRAQAFQQAHQAIERQADEPDDHHAADHQIIAIAGIARVDDQVAEAGSERNHFGRDHHQPCDAKS